MERDARLLVDLLRDRQPVDRSLGQHYLIDEAVLDASLAMGAALDGRADLQGCHVLEIGCGPGVLTHRMIEAGARVTAIEIDEGSLEHMAMQFMDEIEAGSLTLVPGDALKARWPADVDRIIANIPYQISSPLCDRLQQLRHRGWPAETDFAGAVLLVQEEFAERMVMAYEMDRGPRGMSLWLDFDAEMGRRVSPAAFSPQPRVHSRLVALKPNEREGAWGAFDRRLFRQVVKHCFEDRRRKIRNRLRRPPKRLSRIREWHKERWMSAVANLFEEAEDLVDERPELLDPWDWIEICQRLSGTWEEEE